ncbi:hypothetical protein RI367_006882 [Sorochytrium milnesiophthora]
MPPAVGTALSASSRVRLIAPTSRSVRWLLCIMQASGNFVERFIPDSVSADDDAPAYQTDYFAVKYMMVCDAWHLTLYGIASIAKLAEWLLYDTAKGQPLWQWKGFMVPFGYWVVYSFGFCFLRTTLLAGWQPRYAVQVKAIMCVLMTTALYFSFNGCMLSAHTTLFILPLAAYLCVCGDFAIHLTFLIIAIFWLRLLVDPGDQTQRMEAIVPAVDTMALMTLFATIYTLDLEHIKIAHKLEEMLVMSEAAVERRKAITAAVTHELRTPIHGILNCLDLLKKTALETDQSCMVDAVGSCAKNLEQIVNQVLQHCREDYGVEETGALPSQPFDLCNVIQEVGNNVAPVVESKGVDFSMVMYTPDEYSRTLLGDEAGFKQLLLNVVGNAAKFTNKGRVVFSVNQQSPMPPDASLREQLGLTADDCEVVKVRCVVQDSGIGISDTFLKHIFEPYTRDRNARSISGTGLGLFIAHKWVVRAGGSITIASRVNEGTQVTCEVPFVVAPPSKDSKGSFAEYMESIAIVSVLRASSAAKPDDGDATAHASAVDTIVQQQAVLFRSCKQTYLVELLLSCDRDANATEPYHQRHHHNHHHHHNRYQTPDDYKDTQTGSQTHAPRAQLQVEHCARCPRPDVLSAEDLIFDVSAAANGQYTIDELCDIMSFLPSKADRVRRSAVKNKDLVNDVKAKQLFSPAVHRAVTTGQPARSGLHTDDSVVEAPKMEMPPTEASLAALASVADQQRFRATFTPLPDFDIVFMESPPKTALRLLLTAPFLSQTDTSPQIPKFRALVLVVSFPQITTYMSVISQLRHTSSHPAFHLLLNCVKIITKPLTRKKVDSTVQQVRNLFDGLSSAIPSAVSAVDSCDSHNIKVGTELLQQQQQPHLQRRHKPPQLSALQQQQQQSILAQLGQLGPDRRSLSDSAHGSRWDVISLETDMPPPLVSPSSDSAIVVAPTSPLSSPTSYSNGWHDRDRISTSASFSAFSASSPPRLWRTRSTPTDTILTSLSKPTFTSYAKSRSATGANDTISVATADMKPLSSTTPPAVPLGLSVKSCNEDAWRRSFVVLVVDDNSINRMIASKSLMHQGFLVDTACNGRDAVEKVRLQLSVDFGGVPYGVIFMDLKMPVLDGVGATREIKQLYDSYNGHSDAKSAEDQESSAVDNSDTHSRPASCNSVDSLSSSQSATLPNSSAPPSTFSSATSASSSDRYKMPFVIALTGSLLSEEDELFRDALDAGCIHILEKPVHGEQVCEKRTPLQPWSKEERTPLQPWSKEKRTPLDMRNPGHLKATVLATNNDVTLQVRGHGKYSVHLGQGDVNPDPVYLSEDQVTSISLCVDGLPKDPRNLQSLSDDFFPTLNNVTLRDSSTGVQTRFKVNMDRRKRFSQCHLTYEALYPWDEQDRGIPVSNFVNVFESVTAYNGRGVRINLHRRLLPDNVKGIVKGSLKGSREGSVEKIEVTQRVNGKVQTIIYNAKYDFVNDLKVLPECNKEGFRRGTTCYLPSHKGPNERALVLVDGSSILIQRNEWFWGNYITFTLWASDVGRTKRDMCSRKKSRVFGGKLSESLSAAPTFECRAPEQTTFETIWGGERTGGGDTGKPSGFGHGRRQAD